MVPVVERPTLREIESAAQHLEDIIVETPLLEHHSADAPQLWLKAEIHQPGGCFKVRGVFHAVAQLNQAQREAGLSTVSAGNTAKALAWSARRFGVSARSLMPEHAPATKIAAMEALGGTPILVPVDEVFRFLREHGWENEPYAFIHPWTERNVLIGHATLGVELLAAQPELDSVFVPVGGGGLIGGVAAAVKALKPDVRVIAVEPEGCPSLHASLAAGSPQSVPCDTMCDGVAVPYMTAEMYPLLEQLVDECVLVSEVETRRAIRDLITSHHIVAEGSGALGFAAARAVPLAQRGRSACIVTGGSIDNGQLIKVLREDAES